MIENRKISEKLYHIGVNDRKKRLFENMWPLPKGVCYNCYVFNDEKTALIDTVECGTTADFIGRIKAVIGERALDYLVINHMEPDHSGMIKDVVSHYPNVQIVGNAKTHKVIEAYFGKQENLLEVKDGDEISLGSHNLKFVFTPWVHWPETMVTYDTTDCTLFSGDAFGCFGTLDGGVFDDEICFGYYECEMRRYYSNIVGKYSGMVQKAIQKLASIKINTICSVHGPIWRENPMKIVELYDKWSKYECDEAVVIAYASMYGSTEEMADVIARRVSEQGIKDIRIFDVSTTDVSYLINEIWRCKGVILGSCAYNGDMHPKMEHLTSELTHLNIKNRSLAIFGSHSWNGGGVKALKKFAETAGWGVIGEPIDQLGISSQEKLIDATEMAKVVAEYVKGE